MALGFFAMALLACIQALNVVAAGNPASPFSPATSSAYASWTAAARWGTLGVLAWTAPGLLRGRWEPLAWMLTAAGALVAAAGLIQEATGNRYLLGLRHDPGWEPFGPFYYRNHAATFLAQSAGAGTGLLVRAFTDLRQGTGRDDLVDRAARVITVSLLVLLVLFALYRTDSSGGVASALAALALTFTVAGIRSRAARFAALLVLALSAAACLLGAVAWRNPPSPFLNSNSMQFRREIYRSAVTMAADRPLFGHGLGAFASSFPRYQGAEPEGFVRHAHNDFLEVAAEGGLIGVLFVFGAILLALYPRGDGATPSRDGLQSGLTAAAVATLLHACIDFPLMNPLLMSNLVLLVSVLGLPERRKTAPAASLRGKLVAALCAALALASLRPALAKVHLYRAETALPPSKAYYFLQALWWDPAPLTSHKLAVHYMQLADSVPAARLPLLRKALSCANNALREAPFQPAFLYTRGAILWRLGRTEDAREDLRASHSRWAPGRGA